MLIIGIDGCRPDAMLVAQTPNIDQLDEVDGAGHGYDYSTASLRYLSAIERLWNRE